MTRLDEPRPRFAAHNEERQPRPARAIEERILVSMVRAHESERIGAGELGWGELLHSGGQAAASPGRSLTQPHERSYFPWPW